MTAQEALIQQNKKDPRVRYITGGNRMNIVYENKPSFSPTYEHWQCSTGHREVLYYEIDFNGFPTYSDCILCIDDIKEVPPIPEKWYIEYNKENHDTLHEWRRKRATRFIHDNQYLSLSEGYFLLSDDLLLKDGSYYAKPDEIITEEYQKITLEQFKKYVLKEELDENVKLEIAPTINVFSEFLTQQTVRYFSEHGVPVYDVLNNNLSVSLEVINNMISCNEISFSSYLGYLGEYISKLKNKKPEEKFGGVEFKGRYIKTGKIQVPNSFDDSFESYQNPTQPEEKVLYPRRIWIEDRINAINQSVKSYFDYDYCIPTEWIEERNELIETLNNL